MITIRNLDKSFGRHKVLDGVDLDVESGEVVLLLGPNGVGKSTLLRCVLGLMSYSGSIRVCGLDPLGEGRKVRGNIGYMPQRDGLHPDMTVAETLEFYAALRDTPRSRIERVSIELRLDAVLDHRVDEISGGMRQRLAFALVVMDDPPVLLLDEPTASLDGWSRDFLLERVQALAGVGKAILLSTHADHPALGGLARSARLREGRLVSAEIEPVTAEGAQR